jgi:hypothetical protein
MTAKSPMVQPVRQGLSAMTILSDQEHVPPRECHLSLPRYRRFIGNLSNANSTQCSTRFSPSRVAARNSRYISLCRLKRGAI